MDAEKLKKIKEMYLRTQSWDDPDARSWVGGLTEADIDDLFEALEAERRENERLLPYKEAAEAYIANCSIDAFRHLQMVVHKNRQGHTGGNSASIRHGSRRGAREGERE
jgi:hypothetical protein